MLGSISVGRDRLRFIDRAHGRFPGANTFTIIVGKNGTGKSRLLRTIATAFLADQPTIPPVLDKVPRLSAEAVSSVQWIESPARLIGLSTSPFDKFPLLRSAPADYPYSYLGLRGLPSVNLGVAYLGRVIGKLLESVTIRPETAASIANVLRYLRYEPLVEVAFQLPSTSVLDRLFSDNPVRNMTFEWGPAARIIERMSARERSNTTKALLRVEGNTRGRRKLNMAITPSGIVGDGFSWPDEDVLCLSRAGLLKLVNVSLQKSDQQELFDVSSASSGEQAVVISLLGIGSQIQDGTVVLIDEPEVCLHPEWQERYIHLLFDAFSQYRGCHFIIATHSPQVVAQLPEGNCFVLSMEDKRLRSARSFSKRSVDFQLASLFKAPGFKNEYLLRTALGVFADLSKRRQLDDEGKTAVAIFQQVIDLLQEDDPVKELISAILELHVR